VTVLEQRWKRHAEAILGVASSAILFAMMCLTFVDVVLRYVFNRPTASAFELTGLMLAVLIFAGLPLVSYADEHVICCRRDLGGNLPRRSRSSTS
jgi:TRAP-type C4-dicarboxylate transport system permease small subunit